MGGGRMRVLARIKKKNRLFRPCLLGCAETAVMVQIEIRS